MNSIIDLIHQEDKTAFSFEVLPPLKGNGTEQLFRNIDKNKIRDRLRLLFLHYIVDKLKEPS